MGSCDIPTREILAGPPCVVSRKPFLCWQRDALPGAAESLVLGSVLFRRSRRQPPEKRVSGTFPGTAADGLPPL
jgi:hypothetical protein